MQTFGQAAEPNPPRGQLLDDSQDVLGVASETVQFPDGENVVFAEMVEAGIEMRSGGGRAADTMVGVKMRVAPASWSASS
jgi:hypothetical protein